MSENKQVATQQQQEPRDKGLTTYKVAGQDVNLSYQTVRNFLTKGTGTVTDQDIVQFISICKYNQLNPFLNEAYLVKFGTQPAQMIVSKEALMKRAEECQTYEGIQAGVIVMRDGQPVELEGSFYLPTDKLVGGWAKVYRTDRKYPIVAKVRLEEYDKKQSTWNEKQSTMIAKVAKVQALREAFPTQLGAMYTAEEQGVVTEEAKATVVASEIKENANKQTISIDEAQVVVNEPASQPEKPQASAGAQQATMKMPENNKPNAPGF